MRAGQRNKPPALLDVSFCTNELKNGIASSKSFDRIPKTRSGKACKKLESFQVFVEWLPLLLKHLIYSIQAPPMFFSVMKKPSLNNIIDILISPKVNLSSLKKRPVNSDYFSTNRDRNQPFVVSIFREWKRPWRSTPAILEQCSC